MLYKVKGNKCIQKKLAAGDMNLHRGCGFSSHSSDSGK